MGKGALEAIRELVKWPWLSKPMLSHFGGSVHPPILVGILVGIGMFTGGTIRILTLQHLCSCEKQPYKLHLVSFAAFLLWWKMACPDSVSAIKFPSQNAAKAQIEMCAHRAEAQSGGWFGFGSQPAAQPACLDAGIGA